MFHVCICRMFDKIMCIWVCCAVHYFGYIICSWYSCDPFAHIPLQWRHYGCDGVSNHQPDDCSLNRLFRRRSKKTSKLHITGLCEGNSPVTGEFPAQTASNTENVSIWWRHHAFMISMRSICLYPFALLQQSTVWLYKWHISDIFVKVFVSFHV